MKNLAYSVEIFAKLAGTRWITITRKNAAGERVNHTYKNNDRRQQIIWNLCGNLDTIVFQPTRNHYDCDVTFYLPKPVTVKPVPFSGPAREWLEAKRRKAGWKPGQIWQ